MLRPLALLLLLAVTSVTTLSAQTPVVNAKKRTGTITINGNPNESEWEFTNNITKNIVGTSNNTSKFAVLWDSLYLYVAYTITDASKYNESTNAWDDDAVELYIDADNNGGTTYGTNDRQFAKEWNSSTIWERTGKTTGVTHAWTTTSTGYTVEIRVAWSNIGITNPAAGFRMGFDVAVDDDDNGGARESQQMWAGDNDNWQYPRNFGDILLVAADAQAPTAPSNLAASAITQSSLTLNWTASTDNIGVAGYDIYRNGVKLNSTLVTTTSYSVTGLSAATAYQFYVQAKDAAGNTSANSNTISVTTPDTQAPTAPGTPVVSALTPTSLTLTWTASTDNVGVAGYDVFQDGVKINAANITGNSFAVTNLSASTSYQFYIKARDAAGNSTNSTTITATTPAPPDTEAPSAPSDLSATTVAQNSVTLGWTASTDNIGVAGYDIYRNGVKINSTLVTTTSYAVTGLSAATAYQFYVQAKDAAGNTSANSNTISVTTPDTQAPTAPGTPVVSALTPTSLILTWTSSTDNVGVAGYDVFQDGVKINAANITGNSFAVTNLSGSTTYQFYIKASDAAGNSTNSATITATTPAPPDTEAPSAPADLSATTVAQNSVTLGWTASTDNIGVAGYDVYRNGVKINSSIVTTTSYIATGLSAATSYSFYVIAKDASGNSSVASNTISVTTPDTQAPATVTGLQASAIGQNGFTLSWNSTTDNVAVTGYTVLQDGAVIATVPANTTSAQVTGLTANTGYVYSVQASDAAGNTSTSATLVVTTLPPPDTEAPSAPANLNATVVSQSVVNLSWSASTDDHGVTGYDVYNNGNYVASVTGTSYQATGLSALTSYSFYVKAKDAAGNISAESNTVQVTTPDTQAPTAPTGLSSTLLSSSSLRLNWNASTDNNAVAGYDVYMNNVKINSVAIVTTNYDVTGLTQGGTYSFFVRAIDASGNVSAASSTINTTIPDSDAPSAPSNLAASAVTATTLTLNWSASTDNIGVTGYDVYRNGTKINSVAVTTTSYAVTGLTGSTTYSFYVQARDAAGNISANSNTISVTTPSGSVCTGTGSIRFQRWNNATGTAVTNLTSLAAYPNTPTTSGTLTSFEIPTNSGDNYGMKVFGYICPPTTGTYTFWIASDDNAELWLSTTSSATNKVRIAYHTQWTNSREWNKYTTQKSAAITLTAGQLYYVEALMKEGSQGDNMAVGWAKPGQATTTPSEVIPGSQLVAQIVDTQAPTAPTNLTANNITQTAATINWTAATDNIGIAGYDVYRNGTKLNSALVTTLSYTATGLTAATTYSFTVIAKDAAGNSSASSAPLSATTLLPNPGFETFTQRTVISNQRMPHDLVYGPDNNLWYTERFAGTVSYVVPATGVKTVVLTLGSLMQRGGGQDGLMGLALHPEFLTGKPYVYISYTYQSTSATMRKTRIARYTYNSSTKKLEQPVTIIEDIPGSNDHNSARLAVGPDQKLYYTVGDMGAGQFDNMSRTNNSQNLNILEGKILRLNTEAVSGSWIPTDNPFSNGAQKTAVYSFGHRNPQGLVWGNVNGVDILYSSEHGPYSDDEINIIESSRNYGWPAISGFCDGNYNGRTVGGFAVVSEQTNCATLNAKEPIRSLFPASNPPTGGDNMTWPSTGTCGTEFYGSTAIPGWQNSLLVANLKNGTLARFKLSSNGQSIISDTIHYFRGKGRFRDVVVSPDGMKIYLACDSSGSTSGPTGGVTSTPANPGSILEFTYQPASGRFTSELITQTKDGEANKDEVLNKSIEVYPNPASHFMIVYNYNTTPGLVMDLIDMNGKTIKRQAINAVANRVELSQLSNALYIVRITDPKGKVVKTEKIVVQK